MYPVKAILSNIIIYLLRHSGLVNIFIAFTEINPFCIRHLTIQCTYQLLHFCNTDRPFCIKLDKLDNLQTLNNLLHLAVTGIRKPRWMHIANDYKQHIKVLIFFISVQCFRYFTQYFHPPHRILGNQCDHHVCCLQCFIDIIGPALTNH